MNLHIRSAPAPNASVSAVSSLNEGLMRGAACKDPSWPPLLSHALAVLILLSSAFAVTAWTQHISTAMLLQ